LAAALALEPREHVALVGGGGKTSLMFALADELIGKNRRVITSTTTKIWHHEARKAPCVAFTQSHLSWKETLRGGLKTEGHAFLAQSLLESGKVEGISPSLADALYGEEKIEYLLVEADGSSGHPVKAHADHEPVIPLSATMVVAMSGLEAVGKRVGPEVVFRLDRFIELTGLITGERLTPPVLAGLFLERGGLFKGTPPSSKKVVFLNKYDLLTEEQEAGQLAHIILDNSSGPIDRVVIGSVRKSKYFIAKGMRYGKDISQDRRVI